MGSLWKWRLTEFLVWWIFLCSVYWIQKDITGFRNMPGSKICKGSILNNPLTSYHMLPSFELSSSDARSWRALYYDRCLLTQLKRSIPTVYRDYCFTSCIRWDPHWHLPGASSFPTETLVIWDVCKHTITYHGFLLWIINKHRLDYGRNNGQLQLLSPSGHFIGTWGGTGCMSVPDAQYYLRDCSCIHKTHTVRSIAASG